MNHGANTRLARAGYESQFVDPPWEELPEIEHALWRQTAEAILAGVTPDGCASLRRDILAALIDIAEDALDVRRLPTDHATINQARQALG